MSPPAPLVSVLLFAMTIAAYAQSPIPVILDTDIGDDIDDTWALAMVLQRPELDLQFILTASTDTTAKARLTAKILERVGRTDIPIGIGKKTGDHPLNQASWVGDYALDDYAGIIHEDGVGELIRRVNESPQKITLLVIGPQTNIAEALRRDPSIAQNARIVSMAGSVDTGYNGNPKPQPEFNVFRDVAAAQAVFAAPWDITMAPLDVCGTLQLKGDNYRAVSGAANPIPKTIIENYDAWNNRKHYGQHESSVLFDTVAVYLAYSTELCTMETITLSIDEKGATNRDPDGRPVRCGMGWNDFDAFKSHVIKTLIGTR